MKITNFKIYDLCESMVASGFPMLEQYKNIEYEESVDRLQKILDAPKFLAEDQNWKRACRLCNSQIGTGHDNFLSGILVSVNVTATVKWWTQMQRYHFVQIVSSMSTMHRLRSMLRECTFTFPDDEDGFYEMISAFEDAMSKSNNETVSDAELAYRCPMGLQLTARITTNYRQLKTIYTQRKNHILPEWGVFCAWIEKLPFAPEFILGDHISENTEYWNAEVKDRDKKISQQNALIRDYEEKIQAMTQRLKAVTEKYKKMNSQVSHQVDLKFKKMIADALKEKCIGGRKKC